MDNPCYGYGCWDSEREGCTMPSVDHGYDCKLQGQYEGEEFGVVHVLAEYKVKPERRSEFLTYALMLQANSQRESGCKLYVLRQKQGQDNTFAFVEIWKNEAVLELHKEMSHYKEAVPILEDCSESVNVGVYT